MSHPRIKYPHPPQTPPLTPNPSLFRTRPAATLARQYGCEEFPAIPNTPAGRPPFIADGESLAAYMLRCAHEEPPPLRSLRPELPEALEQVVLATLAKEPRERPGLEALAAVFDDVLTEESRQRARQAAETTLDSGGEG